MPYVNVPNDLSKIKTKIAFNLTKRQLICFGGAALVGVLCFTSDVTMLGVVQLLLYQLFWAIIVLAIGGSEKF